MKENFYKIENHLINIFLIIFIFFLSAELQVFFLFVAEPQVADIPSVSEPILTDKLLFDTEPPLGTDGKEVSLEGSTFADFTPRELYEADKKEISFPDPLDITDPATVSNLMADYYSSPSFLDQQLGDTIDLYRDIVDKQQALLDLRDDVIIQEWVNNERGMELEDLVWGSREEKLDDINRIFRRYEEKYLDLNRYALYEEPHYCGVRELRAQCYRDAVRQLFPGAPISAIEGCWWHRFSPLHIIAELHYVYVNVDGEEVRHLYHVFVDSRRSTKLVHFHPVGDDPRSKWIFINIYS